MIGPVILAHGEQLLVAYCLMMVVAPVLLVMNLAWARFLLRRAGVVLVVLSATSIVLGLVLGYVAYSALFEIEGDESLPLWLKVLVLCLFCGPFLTGCAALIRWRAGRRHSEEDGLAPPRQHSGPDSSMIELVDAPNGGRNAPPIVRGATEGPPSVS
jgi:hypothetical protein